MSASLHKYQQILYNTAELCAQLFWNHLPNFTPKNAGHLLILQTKWQVGLCPFQVLQAMF